MQSPTCTGTRIRHVHDAHVVFHAVMLGRLPMITRRLDTDERRAVQAGNVYVWEERGRNADASNLGIERWTDGIRWSASRVRDEFLLYHERYDTDIDAGDPDMSENAMKKSLYNRLVKQTYSVLARTREGDKKWHMTAYFIPSTVDRLRSVEEHDVLSRVQVPPNTYISAKMGKGRALQVYSLPPGGGSFPHEGNLAYHQPFYPPLPPHQHQHQHAQYIHPPPAPHLAYDSPPAGIDAPNLLPPPSLPRNGRALYTPRHPLDDAALRSLRGPGLP